MALPPDAEELLAHAARHPDGVDPLLEGHLESVAALYQVHPSRVDGLRTLLQHPPRREEALAFLGRARLGPLAAPAERLGTKSAQTVVAEAAALPNGLELLTLGPVEAVAVLFGASAFVVEEARARLAAGHGATAKSPN